MADTNPWRKDNATRSDYLKHFAGELNPTREPKGVDPTRLEKALEKAHDIRKFEIDLYWKRAAYFWAFSAAAFAGYFAIEKDASPGPSDPLYVLSCLGFTFSLAWYFVNRGSTAWQRNWERHVDLLEDEVMGPLYKMTIDRYSYSFGELNSGYPFSPSKINLIVAIFVTVVWFALAVPMFCYREPWDYILAFMVAVTAWCLWRYGRTSHSDEELEFGYGVRRYRDGATHDTVSENSALTATVKLEDERRTMEDKEKIAAYLTLYKQQMERFGKTQDIEWKANFGIWTLLSAAIYAAIKAKTQISIGLTGPLLIAVFVVHACWLLAIHHSERFDKRLWVEYRRGALKLIQHGQPEQPFKHSYLKELAWMLIEAGMTGILCWILYGVLQK